MKAGKKSILSPTFMIGAFIFVVVAFVVLGLTSNAVADSKGAELGYIKVDKQHDDLTANGKVEVEAFFWYGCPYCYALESSVQQWDRFQMDHSKIEMFHVPAPIAQHWTLHAAAYYVAEELGILDRSHLETFALIQKSHGQQLNSKAAIVSYYQYKYGADPKKANELFSSDIVRKKMEFDFKRMKDYGLSAVPAIVVGGEYVVTGKTAGGLQQMVPVAKKIAETLASGKKVEGSIFPLSDETK